MPVKKQKHVLFAVLTKQNMSAHRASGHPFMSSALMRNICAALCVETWFPLLTFLCKSCLTLNKLLNFHFQPFCIKAIGPWASCFPVFGPQFVIYMRSTGSAVSKGLDICGRGTVCVSSLCLYHSVPLLFVPLASEQRHVMVQRAS